MSLKAKLEAIIYAAETPITLEQIVDLLQESAIAEGATEGEVRAHVCVALAELIDDYAAAHRGIDSVGAQDDRLDRVGKGQLHVVMRVDANLFASTGQGSRVLRVQAVDLLAIQMPEAVDDVFVGKDTARRHEVGAQYIAGIRQRGVLLRSATIIATRP